MAELSVVSGTLVARFSNPYDFADRETGVRKVGTTRKAFVVGFFEGAPIEVRCDDADVWAQIQRAPQWAEVELTCELRVSQGKITRKAVGFKSVEAA